MYDYDIVVQTLTGNEIEVSVRETDTISYLKYRIKKYEGIPVSQQHILYNQVELKDATVLKDIPLCRGSRLTLVLGMRGGPISARRVATDCDNWYDLSDVLNGTNRGQLNPIEPLTISTSGVKVLLYKDCKKNINRLMKLRKHHLHSHGASGVGSGTGSSSSSMAGNSIKCPAPAARTQLKFLDKHLAGEENAIAVAEAQDQQWLLDNITTLKKMKQLRQSMEAKKKKKPRSSSGDVFSQDLREVQMDLEMHEKLQRWLHRVASNATHLTDAETVPHPQPHLATAAIAAAASPSAHHAHSSSSPAVNLFDRVRRKSAGNSSGLGLELSGGGSPSSRGDSFMHPFARSASGSSGGGPSVGGARKKDSYPSLSSTSNSSGGGGATTAMISSSSYSTRPVDEFAMIARDYRKTAAAVAMRKLSAMVDEDDDEEEEETQYTKLSPDEIDRRLTAANCAIDSDGGGREEVMKKRRESSSQFEERLLAPFYDSNSVQYENLFKAYASSTADHQQKGVSGGAGAVGGGGSSSVAGGGPEMASKFRWRFHSDSSGGRSNQVAGHDTAAAGGAASDTFLNSLLLKRNNNQVGFKSSSPPLNGYDYRRWADTEEQSDELEKNSAAEKEVKEREIEELATVIIEKADENSEEESLLEAACHDILNDPDAFEGDEDEDQLDEVHEKRYELIELMGLGASSNSSGTSTTASSSAGEDSDSGAEFSMLKNEGYFDLEDGEHAESDEDGPVLLYENEETGTATFLGGGQKNFWPNFDYDIDAESDQNGEDDKPEADGCMSLPLPATARGKAVAEEEEETTISEDERTLNCSETEGLEFDDYTYFPSTISSASQQQRCPATMVSSTGFRKQSSSLRPLSSPSERSKSFLPRISREDYSADERTRAETEEELRRRRRKKEAFMGVNHLGGECQPGPSFPEIINRSVSRAMEGRVSYSTLEDLSPGGGGNSSASGGGASKREREEARSASRVQLPDIKLLESDLKMMGLDAILNESDDSFERTIKRHFRASDTHRTQGECLLRTGNEEELKKLRPVGGDGSADWVIQLAEADQQQQKQEDQQKVQKANRCAKCNKKLGIIMIMKCHCGLFFCAQHRYAEAHDCAYDFKEEGKRILAKENPLVVGEKLPKI